MKNLIEDSRNEFKVSLNQNFEKEIIAFLNSKDGGNLYIGISDKSEVIGIDKDIDKIQLEIKDKIKNNISPSPIGLFEIIAKKIEGKNIIHIIIASGNEKPYYLRKLGMSPEGSFIRVGSSSENMTTNMIEDLFSKRTRNSLRNIISPKQELTFSQLKIYYEEKGYSINNNFLKQLNLFTEDGKYNYIGYLLADNNDISIKVAKYAGTDHYDLIENEEYGFGSIVKTVKNIINKLNLENKTFAKITELERREVKMVDEIALREATVNAIVHNDWSSENPPKFELFSNRISISSAGGLPSGYTKEEFLSGFSSPKHPELMRVFKDLGLVEQLGTGIMRILSVYDKNVFEIYPNFLRVNFEHREQDTSQHKHDTTNDTISDTIKITEIQTQIIKLVLKTPTITQNDLAKILDVSRATIARHIKVLVEEEILVRRGSTKKGYWEVVD